MRKLLLRRVTEKDTHMADPLPYPGTPRWVKVSGIVALVLVLLFVIMLLTDPGATALVATRGPAALVATRRP